MRDEARELLHEDMLEDSIYARTERLDPDLAWQQQMEDRAMEPRGPEPGRCGSCGRFVGDGAIICQPCDVSERRREFEAMLP